MVGGVCLQVSYVTNMIVHTYIYIYDTASSPFSLSLFFFFPFLVLWGAERNGRKVFVFCESKNKQLQWLVVGLVGWFVRREA